MLRIEMDNSIIHDNLDESILMQSDFTVESVHTQVASEGPVSGNKFKLTSEMPGISTLDSSTVVSSPDGVTENTEIQENANDFHEVNVVSTEHDAGETLKLEMAQFSSEPVPVDKPTQIMTRKTDVEEDLVAKNQENLTLPKPTTPSSEEDIYQSDIVNGAHGDAYQRDLALVMFQRATRRGYEFRLGYEMALADKFDDVAFFNKGTEEWILVQTKHTDVSKGKSQSLKLDMLFPRDDTAREKGDFSLFKYLKSYVTVRDNIKGRKNVILFTNRDFPADDLTESVQIESRQVDDILDFGSAKQLRLIVKDVLINEMLNYTNRDFNTLRDGIVKLFKDGIVDQAIKNFKTPVAELLTKTNSYVKFSENVSQEAWQMFKALSDLIDVQTVQLPLDKCKELFTGKSRNKTWPLRVEEETVHQFFRDLTLCVRQPDELRDIIGQDLRLWMRTWIQPSYLMRLENSQLEMCAVFFEKFFSEKQAPIVKENDKASYKKFLDLTDGEEFLEGLRRDLEKQIQNLTYYNDNDTKGYYVNRQIELFDRMPNFNSNRIGDIDFVKELLSGNLDKQRLLLLTAEPGMGKSTILEHMAFAAQKTSRDNVYLFNLNTLHRSLNKVKNGDIVDNFLSVLKMVLSEENFINIRNTIVHSKNSDKRHLMIFDAFDEVVPENRSKVLQLFKHALNAKNVNIVVSARKTVKAMVENAFKVKSMSLVPFNDDDQTNFLRKFWKVSQGNETHFLNYKTHLFKVFYSDINRALNEFTGLPLMLKMLGEVYADHFEKYLKSEQHSLEMSQEQFSTIKLYEKFVSKCFDTRMTKKYAFLYEANDNDNLVLFKNFTYEHQLLAIKYLKIEVLKSEKHSKATEAFEERVISGTEKSPLVEAADNDYRFIHRSYAEYLVAIFLFSNIEEGNTELFGACLKTTFFIDHPMIRIFFFAIFEAESKTEHFKIIESFYMKHSDIALWACEVHGRKTVQNLLQVKCDSTIINRLLCVAAEHNCYDICSYLFKNYRKEVDCSFIDWNPLEEDHSNHNNGWNPLHIAAQNGHPEVIKLILENSGNVNVTNNRSWTPLHFAALNGHREIVRILIENFGDVNAKDVEDCVPLHCASCSGHTEVIKLLLANTADVDAVNKEDWTSLLFAAHNGQTDVVRLLIDHSANPNIANNIKCVPLDSAAYNGHKGVVEILLEKYSNVNVKLADDSTALHVAAAAGHTDIVKLLIARNADVNLLDRNDCTPLHCAAQNGHFEIVKLLIKNLKDINATARSGRTSLHFAAEDGNADIVKLLVEYHCQPNAKDSYGWTPLHYAAASGNLEAVTLLIDKFEDVNERGYFGRVPLHLASEYGHTEVVRLLVQNGGNVNVMDNDKWMPLHFAAEYGHTEAVRILITNGAAIDAKVDYDRKPIDIAAENGQTEVVKVLILKSANITAEGDSKRTPLHYAAKNGHTKVVAVLIDHLDASAKDVDDWTPLHYAARNGHKDVAKLLINHSSVNVNAKCKDGCTALHVAAEYGQLEILNDLINNHADVTAREANERTTLHYAARNGHLEIVEILVDDHSLSVNAQDINEWTPLHYAALNGHMNIATFMIDHFTNVSSKTNKGRIPLHYAARNGHLDVVQLLMTNCPQSVHTKDNDGRTARKLAEENGHSNVVQLLNAERQTYSLTRTALKRIRQLITLIRKVALSIVFSILP